MIEARPLKGCYSGAIKDDDFQFRNGRARVVRMIQEDPKTHVVEERTSLPSAIPSEPAAPCWTRTRQEVLHWLRRCAPSVGDIYETTVVILFVVKVPARARMVAHGVREIANNLPRHLGSAVEGRVPYEEAIDELLPQWQEAGLPVGEPVLNIAADAGEPQISRSVPIPLINRIGSLLSEHEDGRSRVRERAKDLFTLARKEEGASEAQLATAIQQWIKVCRWFVARVHRDVPDEDLLTEEFFRQFDLFERLLHTLAAKFFDIVEGLDEFLDEANR